MFAEDMAVFFDEVMFAVHATFTPSGSAAVSSSVLFNADMQGIFSDDVLSDEFSMTYPATALPGVKSGDYGTVDGVRYRVREVRLKGDGRLKVAKLAKVPGG